MARERYLVNAGEETIHSGPVKPETAKDKRKNWWFYHKGHLLAGVIAAALVFSFFYSIFSKVKPDYTVALLTSYTMPESGKQELERCLTPYADDRNGDGRVTVSVVNYVFSGALPTSSEMMQQQNGQMAKFMADCSLNESMIFLYDVRAFELLEENFDGFFQYNDGTPMPETADDYENARVGWSEIPAFSSFSPVGRKGDSFTGDMLLELYEKLWVSVRTAEGSSIEKKEKDIAYYKDSMEFYERLKTGRPIEAGEQ